MQFIKVVIRFLELVLILSMSVFIIYIIYGSEDRATLIDCIDEYAVCMAFLFPISIPLAVCGAISLIGSISLKTVYAKFVFGIHMFNILAIPLMLLILPSNDEPTAQMMAENLNSRHEEFVHLIDSIDVLIGDNDGFAYRRLGGEIEELSVRHGNEWFKKNRVEAVWTKNRDLYGFSQDKQHAIDALMEAANIQGIYFIKEEQDYSYLFKQWGHRDFVYRIYKSRDKARSDYEIRGQEKSYIRFNDTVAFVCSGGYPGNGAFADYERFGVK